MKHGFKYGLYAGAFFLALLVSAYATTLVIVKGQPEVVVPDVTGQGAITALKTLSDLGLNIKVRAIDYSDSVPQDYIISQDPKPGTKVKKKRDIKVVLSKGSAFVPLPDLSGLSVDQAGSILEQSRLIQGQVSYAYGFGPEQGRDRVLAQYPEPMTPVKVETKIDLLLSLGPRPVFLVMPDLTGQPYSVALYKLEQAGLTLGRLDTEARPDWPQDTVVIQDPSPGSRTWRGNLVRLTVNRAEALDLTEYSFKVLEYDVPYGLFRREIKFRVSFGPYPMDLHEGWHQPGQTVRAVVLTQGPTRAQVFEDGEEKALPADKQKDIGVDHDQDSPLDTVS
jgi:serine/threonine-protein kinase